MIPCRARGVRPPVAIGDPSVGDLVHVARQQAVAICACAGDACMHRVVLPAAVGGGDQRGRKTHRCVTGAQLQCFGDAHAAIAAGQHGADRRQVGLADAGHAVALQAGDVLQGFGEIAGIEQGQRPGLRGVRRGDARIQLRREVAQAVGIGSGVDRGASQGFHARDHRRVGGEQAQGVDAQARGVVAGIDAVPAVAPGQGRRASGIERMAEQRRAGERRGREQQRGGEQCPAQDRMFAVRGVHGVLQWMRMPRTTVGTHARKRRMPRARR